MTIYRTHFIYLLCIKSTLYRSVITKKIYLLVLVILRTMLPCKTCCLLLSVTGFVFKRVHLCRNT